MMCLFCIANIVIIDGMVMQGARASSAMDLVYFAKYIQVGTPYLPNFLDELYICICI